jgi:hypothetical protein
MIKVLKEFKGSRFKVFSSEEEASKFSTSTQPLQETQVCYLHKIETFPRNYFTEKSCYAL